MNWADDLARIAREFHEDEGEFHLGVVLGFIVKEPVGLMLRVLVMEPFFTLSLEMPKLKEYILKGVSDAFEASKPPDDRPKGAHYRFYRIPR